jgi:hydroxyethylthiazole kinase-like sugar kinase family protein
MRALAVVFAAIAVGCMVAAIVGMVTGRPGDRIGGLLRVLAVLCFAGAVALNVAAH